MKKIYFVGAGGIGMANLVRYYLSKGIKVAGYDRTATQLTDKLQTEGAILAFTDSIEEAIPQDFRNPEETLVVYTPAVPADTSIMTYFRQGGFRMMKRAALLGDMTRREKAICIAGSHGKTTTCCMTSWILAQTPEGCNAFLGGILRNTGSNLMLCEGSDIAVVEADEYDRSFHHLSPWIAVVTSTDPDHLDIYGDEQGYLEGFRKYTSLIVPGGYLLLHTGTKLVPDVGPEVTSLTYSGHLAAMGGNETRGDWSAECIRFEPGRLFFTLAGPDGVRLEDIELGVPVMINVDNAVAAAAAAYISGASEEAIRKGLATFRGARRRFEIIMRGDAPEDHGHILIDDYAHSPNEVSASIESVRRLYPGKKLSVIFQPHLYSRTRDFAPEFAKALSAADEVILPEIYPARELPIPGVDSGIILKDITCEKKYCERKDLLNLIKNSNFEILMTLGAADIDVLLPDIEKILKDSE
ncbi:MAG: UDP-N-acetylmuramate--L-alanine ligase [Clostridium sp.]|nr:UDP-N-acetylmuramate--L-alanine ligase [Prevotella sp.]MCM1429596.1 UDP-N-acetylmuramate--L-alanine ligase [Clostridium sp.]